jgi:hypothetical protein
MMDDSLRWYAEAGAQEEARWQPVIDALAAERVAWRWMPRFPDYLVTEDGRIYSGRKLRIKKMRQPPNVKGYPCVKLFNSDGEKHFPVHRAVAIAFFGDPSSPDLHVNHKDGNKQNNSVGNLEWCTNDENMRHSRAMGLHKMTDEQRRIFAEYSRERRQLQAHEAAAIKQTYTGRRGELVELAAHYGVHKNVIWKLVKDKTYRDIGEAA